jgi:hypothetical protein
VPPQVSSLIRILLQLDVNDRLSAVTDLPLPITIESLPKISYDKMRRHPFFTTNWSLVSQYQMKLFASVGFHPNPMETTNNQNNEEAGSEETKTSSLEFFQTIFQQSPSRIPSLHDLCLRAVGQAAVQVAFETANNGGARPSIPWMQVKISLFFFVRCC